MASGVFTCIKFASTIVFIVGGVHIFKRKTLMVVGACFMGAFLFGLGAVLKTHPPAASGNDAGSPSAQGMMALIYLFVVAYSVSWGPLQWIYIGEIFPNRIRDYGMGLGAANIWLWNFVVSKITPISILNIGWKTWMVRFNQVILDIVCIEDEARTGHADILQIFGTLNIIAAIFAWLLPETKVRAYSF